MAKVLVADHERYTRKTLTSSLGKFGYDVVDAANGRAALELAGEGTIDLIFLDVAMPGKDGWQILTELKANRHTRTIPVIMLAALPSADTEATCIRLGAAHVLSKPWHPETLATTVRVVLREAQKAVEEVRDDPRDDPRRDPRRDPEDEAARGDPILSEASPPRRKKPKTFPKFVGTGGMLPQLDKALGGGIPVETLTLVEGPSAVGKSVVCQYMTYGAIVEGRGVAYYSSESKANSLVQQMGSIGLDPRDYLQEDQLGFFPLQKPSVNDDPGKMLAALVSDIEDVPPDYGLIVVDHISDLVVICEDRSIMGFFASCLRLCADGKAIVLVAQSAFFDKQLLARLHGLCNTHISITAEVIREKLVKTLEVAKVGNVELRKDNRFSFEIEPKVGVRIVPMSRVVI